MRNAEVERAPKAGGVDAAIEIHRAACAVLQALGDNVDDATLSSATEAESAAMMALCAAPGVNVDELFVALRYILDLKTETEDPPMEGHGYGALAVALRSYFEQPDPEPPALKS